MQRSIWFARRRQFRDNLSAESARVACSCSSTSQPTPASHFLASHGWPELSTRRREAGVACLSIAASRPKLHVQEHSPLNGRCQVAVGLHSGRSFRRRTNLEPMPVVLAWWVVASQSVVRGLAMLLDVIDAALQSAATLLRTSPTTSSRIYMLSGSSRYVSAMAHISHPTATWI
jgi:hypothetical protein